MTEVDVHGLLMAAQEVTGCELVDQTLALVALHPDRRGFSRLEFVGDAVLNLSVFCTGELAGVPRPRLQQVVGNELLDDLIAASAIASARRSGDVLEALVGAVHLASGFEVAWATALRIAGAAAGVDPATPPPPVDGATSSPRGMSFIGSAVLRAVVADHLCRHRPDENHASYSDARAAHLTTAGLAELWRRGQDPGSAQGDDEASDLLEASIARRFLAEGWERVHDVVVRLLALPTSHDAV
jgi:hypothetical protein